MNETPENKKTYLKIVRTEPNNSTTEVLAIQNGLTVVIKLRIISMACVVFDMLEVEDPQATKLVADDVSACQVAVDEA